jgi:hypothetical protein
VTAAERAPCAWLLGEGLLAEERGEPISAHLERCPACRQLHGEIAALRATLGTVPQPGPPDGWQRAVWSRVDRRRRPRLMLAWLAVPLAAAAALLLLVRPRPEAALALAVHFEHDAERARTRGDLAVGDRLVVEATGLSGGAELRVYRDDAGLVFRCDGPPACQRRGQRLAGAFQIPAIGRYRVVLLTGRSPLTAPRGSLDEDLAAAEGAGAELKQAAPVEVW